MIAADAAAQHRGRSAAMDPDAKRPTTEEAARMRTERMTEALGLDETQARTVYDQCLREAQLQRQLSEVRQENAANMKRILNEKQYAEWQRMHERRRGRMHHGTRPEGPSLAARGVSRRLRHAVRPVGRSRLHGYRTPERVSAIPADTLFLSIRPEDMGNAEDLSYLRIPAIQDK